MENIIQMLTEEELVASLNSVVLKLMWPEQNRRRHQALLWLKKKIFIFCTQVSVHFCADEDA